MLDESGLAAETGQVAELTQFSLRTAQDGRALLKAMARDLMLRQIEWQKGLDPAEEGPFMKATSALFALSAAIKNHASSDVSLSDAHMIAVACGTIAAFARMARDESQLQKKELSDRLLK